MPTYAKPLPRIRTKLVRRRDAESALGIGKTAFWQHWSAVFTDPRAPEDRRPRVERAVYMDELDTAIAAGGRMSGRAKSAVLAFRKVMGRDGR